MVHINTLHIALHQASPPRSWDFHQVLDLQGARWQRRGHGPSCRSGLWYAIVKRIVGIFGAIYVYNIYITCVIYIYIHVHMCIYIYIYIRVCVYIYIYYYCYHYYYYYYILLLLLYYYYYYIIIILCKYPSCPYNHVFFPYWVTETNHQLVNDGKCVGKRSWTTTWRELYFASFDSGG